MSQSQNISSTDCTQQAKEQKAYIKLPTLDLPTFSGNYQDWVSFSDLFQAVIHNNDKLSQVQKLQYLKSSLKGEASRLLSTVAITEANYGEAWQILADRYSNKKQIVQSHLVALHSQQKVQHESPKELRRLLDTTTEHLRALSALGLPTDQWDCLVVFIMTERLDATTRRHWELTSSEVENPTFTELKVFLEKRCRALEVTTSGTKTHTTTAKTQFPRNRPQGAVSYQATILKCVACSESHPLFKCQQFLALSMQARLELVQRSNLCINCFKAGHKALDCQISHCRRCNAKHNTLLHINKSDASKEDNSVPKLATSGAPTVAIHHSTRQSNNTSILLATAILSAKNSSGMLTDVRAILDCGSQTSFITEKCVENLGLSSVPSTITVTGIGGSQSGCPRGRVKLVLNSKCTQHEFELSPLILKKVTGILPQQSVSTRVITDAVHDHKLILADPNYHRPGQIDLLIGADAFYGLLLPGQLSPFGNGLVIQNTLLGWIIGGPVPGELVSSALQSHHALEDLSHQLRQFWEIEEVPRNSKLDSEEQKCEEHFVTTHTRMESGRFMVKLPFHTTTEALGDTRSIALCRLMHVERRLQMNAVHKQEYIKFMREYVQLGHMELVSNAANDSKSYYLPHHPVIKSHAASTQFRVVFDGSASPTNGLPLNKTLMVGSQLQLELPDIITNFRCHKFVFTADIGKMYRQVMIHPQHRNFQRILWREEPERPIQEYQLCTVTYGTSAAPFLAVRCLMELAEQGRTTHPLAYPIIKHDFYVDDVLSGTDSLEKALQAQKQLIQLLSTAGMELHKWTSNHQALLDAIPTERLRVDPTLNLTPDIKTLGIIWNPATDQFVFKVTLDPPSVISKRTILSQVSSLFDPLGWVAPVIVQAKILIQKLWLLPVGWDGQLPAEVVEQWQSYSQTLTSLEHIHIPRRFCSVLSIERMQIHGFCDASEEAYGAVIYIRCSEPNGAQVALVRSKSRVAPLKQISLPRLELCGALILSRLITHVLRFLKCPENQLYLWTDSTIVLSWLSKPSRCWKTFVANRVAEIQESISISRWHHVRSQDNPADCLSRGLTPSQLQPFALWWNGPSWLSHEEDQWPSGPSPASQPECSLPDERRQVKLQANFTSSMLDMAARFSSWTHMVRILAYCLRFIKNCKSTNVNRTIAYLTVQELEESQQRWCYLAQRSEFSRDIHTCLNKQPLHHHSKLLSLNPFLDGHKLLRVGGRLTKAPLSFSRKHPIILPQHHVITKHIVRSYHLGHLHAGPQLLLALIRLKFWIIGAKSVIRRIVHDCVRCFKFRTSTAQQLMGTLPEHRVSHVRPFFRCGVDYAGPIIIRATTGRGRIQTFKAYICLFICFTSKAIHLELAGDLTTNTFLAAFRRFIARRGKPADVYSDCGTNFIGAHNQLTDIAKLLNSKEHKENLSGFAHQEAIVWHFNPPLGPHFGGLWEAGVKSVKYHLRQIVGATLLTYEELQTILIQIEACLNSRPLCPLSDDSQDLNYLTPGHFLIGDSLQAAPDHSLQQSSISTLGRWRLVQQCFQHFWQRWTTEHLSSLQQRPKWASAKLNLKVGDLVLLKDKSFTPFKWPMGRIVAIHPGSDDLVRVVTIKTSTGTVKRPITSCCLLPLHSASDMKTSVEGSFKAGDMFIEPQ